RPLPGDRRGRPGEPRMSQTDRSSFLQQSLSDSAHARCGSEPARLPDFHRPRIPKQPRSPGVVLLGFQVLERDPQPNIDADFTLALTRNAVMLAGQAIKV